jgi:hypothetical protein
VLAERSVALVVHFGVPISPATDVQYFISLDVLADRLLERNIPRGAFCQARCV